MNFRSVFSWLGLLVLACVCVGMRAPVILFPQLPREFEDQTGVAQALRAFPGPSLGHSSGGRGSARAIGHGITRRQFVGLGGTSPSPDRIGRPMARAEPRPGQVESWS